jgi:hypothetical protein
MCVKSSLLIIELLFFVVISSSGVSAVPVQTAPTTGPSAESEEPLKFLALPPSAGPVKVRASFHLLDISEIDEEAETFAFSGVMTLQWRDERQAFDPVRAGVKERIFQGDFQFNELSPAWFPQLVLTNPSGSYDFSAIVLRVKPDGSSTLTETINAVAETRLDLHRMPFDSQRLEAVFEVFGFDTSEVLLDVDPVSILDQQSEVNIPQWTLNAIEIVDRKLVAPYAGNQGVCSAMALSVHVQRQPPFMIRLVIVPVGLICMLSWVVFWMDRSSLGDRINVSFVGILTAAAYQIVVGDITPHISYETLMNRFLNISFWVMCATVVVNLMVGEADKAGNIARGDRIDRICRWFFPLTYLGMLLVALAIAFLRH